MIKPTAICAVLAVLSIASPCHAEIRQCGGVWTDRECGPQGQRTPEAPAGEPSEKERILVELAGFASTLRPDFGSSTLEYSSVQVFCRKFETAVEECRARALRAEKTLLSFYQSTARIRQRQQELMQHQEELALRRERQSRVDHFRRGKRQSRR